MTTDLDFITVAKRQHIEWEQIYSWATKEGIADEIANGTGIHLEEYGA